MEDENEPIISSYLPDTELPEVNYKHLYLTHRIISSRIRTPSNPTTGEGQRPLIVDAISSIEAGGLPGHSEAIYSLALFRHPLAFNLDIASCLTCDNGISRGQDTEASGRDWLLSGSRDKTLRLWQLDHPKPRVVKVLMGGHTGSVLSTFVVKLSKASAFDPASKERKEKILAVSGGSDGRICSWDIKGDGTPEKQVSAHTDSVLCVKGDTERIVSCSKGKSFGVTSGNPS
jgi:WD40 repeat protein